MTTQLSDKLIAVEVPPRSKDNWIMPVISGKSTCMLSFNDHYGHDGKCEKLLPEGKWEILGICNNKEVGFDPEPYIDKVMNGENYQNYNFKAITDRWVKNAADPFLSLLQSKGLDLDKNYLIIEKI